MFTHIHFQTIGVVDTGRALAFYRDKLGFEVERDNPYGADRWIFMRIPGARTLLHFDARNVHEPADVPVLILATADVDGSCDELRRRGVDIASEPADAPWEPGTRWAYIRDSEGNLILIQTIKGGPANG